MARLAESNRPVADVIPELVGLMNGTTMAFAQSAAQVVDFYLDPERAKEFAEIKRLIAKNDAKSNELLKGYVREGMSEFLRLDR